MVKRTSLWAPPFAFLHVIVVEPCTVDSPQKWTANGGSVEKLQQLFGEAVACMGQTVSAEFRQRSCRTQEASRTLTCSREAKRIGRIGLARSAQQSGMCCDWADVMKAAQESRGVQTIIYDNAEFAEMAPAKCMKTIGVDF